MEQLGAADHKYGNFNSRSIAWKRGSLRKRIQERVGLQELQARITHAHRRLEPFERLGAIAPLRVDRGVLVRRVIALRRLQFRKLGFRIRVRPELVVDHRQTLLTVPSRPAGSRMRRARSSRSPSP